MKQIKIKDNLKRLKGKLRFTAYKAGTKEIIKQTDWMSNLIVLNNNNGMNLLIKRLIGNTTHDLIITSAEIGTNNTAPVDADEDLVSPEVTGIEVVDATEENTDKALFEFFISDGELPEGDYKEFGLRCGTQLFCRALIDPTYTKATGSDTKVEYIISVNNT